MGDYEYSIYCNEEATTVSGWSNVPITTCPNNASHDINTDSIGIISQVARPTDYVCNLTTVSTSSYKNIGCFLIQGTSYYANDTPEPKYLKVNAKIDIGTYDINIVDDSNNSLFTSTGNSNSTFQNIVFDFGTISLPVSPTTYTIQAKNSAGGSGVLTIRHAIIYMGRAPE